MDDPGPSGLLASFLLLLIFDAVIYGFHSAMRFLTDEDVEKRLSEKPSDKRSLILQKLLDAPNVYIYTVHLFTVTVNLLAGRLYLERLHDLLQRLGGDLTWPGAQAVLYVIAFLILIWLILSFGIVLPRKVAAHYPAGFTYATVYFIRVLIVLLRPVTALSVATARLIMRLFGMQDDVSEQDVTEEKIRSMVTEGFEQGVLQDTEADMITNIFELSDKQAQDIMTHRGDIVAIDARSTLKEAVSFMLEGNNSRFPVYEDSIDHIIGILHIRDAMEAMITKEADHLVIKRIGGLIRQAHFVPETRGIDTLFGSMQASQTQMVIVIDEYGQTAGLVSMEDILEEIVGNILDEYDEDEAYIAETANDGEYVIDGKTPLTELTERFGIGFEDEECETLNGLMIAKLDRIPADDEEFETQIGGYLFRIVSVSNHMIQSVLVKKIKEEQPEEHADERPEGEA
ncbi:MAG: HlyC/CorC family transporter [Lachnospiraceae bacterium]|nr:HlyC/CorC family transporter [Lachnospiraceae bacterium]